MKIRKNDLTPFFGEWAVPVRSGVYAVKFAESADDGNRARRYAYFDTKTGRWGYIGYTPEDAARPIIRGGRNALQTKVFAGLTEAAYKRHKNAGK